VGGFPANFNYHILGGKNMKKGKKYAEVTKSVDLKNRYAVSEAMELACKTSTAKFDASVDVVFRLNIDPRKAEQNLRGATVLPHGTGKTRKVLVIASGAKADEAKAAGADYVGEQEYLDQIQKGWFDFDVMITTPDKMAALGRFGKLLGPKGLMPNPKTGTVTMDVEKAVKDVKNGKVEYRTDKTGNIALPIGKVSFGAEKLAENYRTIYDVILKLRPQTVKGAYVKNISVSSTMGPGIKVDPEDK
jgi:large subunit ribosomal protein L1